MFSEHTLVSSKFQESQSCQLYQDSQSLGLLEFTLALLTSLFFLSVSCSGLNVIKLFSLSPTGRPNKLECLYLLNFRMGLPPEIKCPQPYAQISYWTIRDKHSGPSMREISIQKGKRTRQNRMEQDDNQDQQKLYFQSQATLL